MILSTKAKESFKTALAMTISYGIALSLNWERPYWAGYAVAFISLATFGQSLNKAALRMLGTLVAVVASLLLISLFPQDRWLFMLVLSSYVGFCTYMMGGKRNQYFWYVCGFVCALICMTAGPDSANAFQIAMLRAQETGLGILVYSVVAILVWPTSTRADFAAVAGKLASIQHQLYRTYVGLVSGEGNAGEAQALRAQEIQALTRFSQLLDAAESDTYDIWELRGAWRLYRRQTMELAETMGRWYENFAELQEMELQKLVPNLEGFWAELDMRFAQIERMLDDHAPEQHPTPLELALDEAEVRALSHFEKAALAVTRAPLLHLEALTRDLFDGLCHIKGFGQADTVADAASSPHGAFLPDLDRLKSAVRIMATLWIVYLAWLYVDGIPGGAGFVSMAGTFGMILANTPQLSVSMLFLPTAASVLFGGVVHIFVMPPLSSFVGLGLIMFSVTFAICYLFASPRQGLARAFGLAMFVTIASISNEQTYSFLGVATTALMFPLIFLALAITAYFPFSLRPEGVFLSLLGRFFRSCEYLISAMRQDPSERTWDLNRWRKGFHVFEVSTLPRKLGTWAPHIHAEALPDTSPEQVQTLITSLQGLAYRMHGLLETSGDPQAPFVLQELRRDIRAWRLKVQGTFQRLSEDPAAAEQETLRAGLADIMGHLERSIKETLERAPEGELSDQDGGNFYRLLGAYRGVSEALVDFAANAGVIDWTRWREERF
jgi:uncharacterized membrane protein YccC